MDSPRAATAPRAPQDFPTGPGHGRGMDLMAPSARTRGRAGVSVVAPVAVVVAVAGLVVAAVSGGVALLAAGPGRRLWLAGRVKRDDWNGRSAAELHIDDAAFAD